MREQVREYWVRRGPALTTTFSKYIINAVFLSFLTLLPLLNLTEEYVPLAPYQNKIRYVIHSSSVTSQNKQVDFKKYHVSWYKKLLSLTILVICYQRAAQVHRDQ